MDYLAFAEHAVAIGGAVVTATSGICALTPTPAPTTTLGKLYRGIELAALLVGRAKDAGVMPEDAAADKAGAAAVAFAEAVRHEAGGAA